MKSLLPLAILSFFLFSCHFRNPENKTGNDGVGTVYGNPFDYSQNITVTDLIPIAKRMSLDTVVSGKIKSICNNGKCVTVAATDSIDLIIKWNKDFTLGNETVSKTILANGHAYRDSTLQKQYIFEATGIVIY